MRTLLFLILLATAPLAKGQSFFDQADAFFAKNVKDGVVDYKSIKANPKALNDLVKYIAELDLSNKRVTPDFQKAFYINAYNILVIKEVMDLYPIEGPSKVDGFFNGIGHTVMGQKMTLDQLEKGTLYKQFPDPRLHFVLVCAAKGCPPLASKSFKPTNLDQQLEERTKYVMNLDWFIRVNKGKAQVSKIFEWYGADFKEDAGSVTAYINQYRDKKLTGKLGYYEYDWSLNE